MLRALVFACAMCCISAFAPPCTVSSLRHFDSRICHPRSAQRKVALIRTADSRPPWRKELRTCVRMAGFVEQVDSEGLEVALQETTGPMVIDFFATWCGPCVMLAPQLEKVADDYQGKVRFLKLDTDQNEAISTAMKIFGLPTLLFIKDGKVLKRIEGALMANKLRSVCDFLFFGGPKPQDDDLRNLLEDDLLV